MRNLFCCLLLILSFDVAAIPQELPLPASITKTDPRVDTANKRYAEGIQALAKNHLAQAQKAFEASHRAFPNAYSLLGMAEVAFKQKRMKEAQQYIQQAVELSPENPYAQNSLARLYASQQRYKEAETTFKKAIVLAPRDEKNYIDLGDLYMTSLGQPEQAINTYIQALAINPEHAGAHYALGVAYLRSGKDTKLAEQELKRASELAPNNPQPKQMLGKLYTANKQYSQALELYTELLRQYPNLSAAHMGRGHLYLAQSKLELAEKDFKTVTQNSPKNVDAWMQLGLIYQGQKRWHESEKAYLTAIKLQPKIALAYNNLAWMSAERKQKLAQSLKWAKQAVALAPNAAEFLDTLGWVYKARKEYPLAISTLLSALKIKQDPQTYYHLGLVYLEKGDKKQAKTALQKSLGMKQAFNGSKEAATLLKKL